MSFSENGGTPFTMPVAPANGYGGRAYADPGYSRYSIGDRAVEKLEQLMDTAQSGYEQEELHKFIRMIRQAAD